LYEFYVHCCDAAGKIIGISQRICDAEQTLLAPLPGCELIFRIITGGIAPPNPG